MTAPAIVHKPRIIRQQRGPLGYLYWFQCSCGTKSPETVYQDVAKLAETSHNKSVGLA